MIKGKKNQMHLEERISIVCSKCFDIAIVDSIEQLEELMKKICIINKRFARTELEKNEWSNIMASASLKNQKDKIEKSIKEHGFVNILCRKCFIKQQQEAFSKKGIWMVRRFNILIEVSLYEKFSEAIESEIIDNEFDRTSFWS